MSPVAVASTPSTATRFAMPKSIRRTVPEGSSMMFEVFRSRWMMPTACMASSPSAIWMPTP